MRHIVSFLLALLLVIAIFGWGLSDWRFWLAALAIFLGLSDASVQEAVPLLRKMNGNVRLGA